MFLEILNCLLCNVCILHSLNKHTPGGRLVALAFYPFDKPSLYYFFIILRMGTEACINCGCVKFHSFKNCPRLAGSFSAHICSDEFEIVATTCRVSETFTLTFLIDSDLHLYNTQQCDSITCTHTHLTHTARMHTHMHRHTHDGNTSLTSHRHSKLSLHCHRWLRLCSSWLWWLRPCSSGL